MARIFISHSSRNNPAAIAFAGWLKQNGWDDFFLDVDPVDGISPGERWEKALRDAADRCEAVIFLVSKDWLASEWCIDEFRLTRLLGKRKLFGVVIEPVPFTSIPSEMTREWQLCDLTDPGETQRFESDYKNRKYATKFSTSGLERLKIGLHKAGLSPTSFEFDPERSPYPGLIAMQEQDAAIFFGRDAQIVTALDDLRALRETGAKQLFVILGASGTGKSSFLRAGLLARLLRDDRNFLPIPVIRPETAAINGSKGVAAALSAALGKLQVVKSQGDIKKQLKTGGGFEALIDEIRAAALKRIAVADKDARAPAVIISIDQAEELFAPAGLEEGKAFLKLIAGLKAMRGKAMAVATTRSDRFELLQASPELEELGIEPFNLAPIAPAYYSTLIDGPAERRSKAGKPLSIDPQLRDRLIADIAGEGDVLPLLAFTLHRLFTDYGEDGKLELHEYREMGEIRGAINRAVKDALQSPDAAPAIAADPLQQDKDLRELFLPRLVRLDAVALRQRAILQGMTPQAIAYVDRLVQAGILMRDRQAEQDTVEISHEVILRKWDRLESWLREDSEDLRIRESLERAAADWQANERGESYLTHTDIRLAAAERVMGQSAYGDVAGPAVAAYLKACREREDRKLNEDRLAVARERSQLAEIKRQQEKRWRVQMRWAAAMGIATVFLAAGLALVLLQARHFADTRGRLTAEAAYGQQKQGHFDSSLRLALLAQRNGEEGAARVALRQAWDQSAAFASGRQLSVPTGTFAESALATSLQNTRQIASLFDHEGMVQSAVFSPDGSRIVTASKDNTARLWDAAGKELAVLRGHESPVTSAAFSPDGNHIVTASGDNTARLWDAAGKELAVLRGHENEVTSAVFSPDGSRIFTASDDNTARLWNAAGEELAVLRGHEEGVTSAVFSPDGSRIVTASNDNTARLWDAAGMELAVLRGHKGPVRSAAFSLDGSRIVTASGDKTARLWDAAGKELAVLRGHENTVWSAVFSPDGSRIVTASYDKTGRLWNAAGEELAVLRGHEGPVRSAAFSLDGSRIVTASGDKTARLWDAAGKELAVLRGHESPVTSAAFSPDGSRIVTASEDNTARLWNAAGEELAVLRGHEDGVWSAVFSPDGSRIVTASEDKTARLWNAAGKELAVLRGHESPVTSAAFSPDGSRIVTASEDNTARLWNAAGEELAVLRGHEAGVTSAVFSPDGSLIATASFDNTARLWNAAGEELAVLRGHAGWVSSAVFSPDGSRIVTDSSSNTARLWDVAGKELAVLKGHEESVTSAAFSPDGSRIVTASEDNTARLWSAAGEELAVLRGHEGPVRSAAFSLDGSRIVTASGDKTARLWDAAGKELAVLRGHEDGVWSAVFSPDGSRIVTASGDNTARLWNGTGKELAVLRGHEDGVWSAVFSPDGSLIATASFDNTARLWDVTRAAALKLDDLARLACDRYLGGSALPTADELRLVGMDGEAVSDLCADHGNVP